jgi:DNA-binding HxlR family transcriptional regulator
MMRPKTNKLPPPPIDCPLKSVLQILAGAWTPEILWYVSAEARRFGDLKRDLGKISSKVLTTRLRELEEKGIIIRTVMPTSPPTVEYQLSELGRRLQPVLDSMVEVGVELLKKDKTVQKNLQPTLNMGSLHA